MSNPGGNPLGEVPLRESSLQGTDIIPSRGSSLKGTRKRALEDHEPDLKMLRDRQKTLRDQINKDQKKLKLASSFDSTIWTKTADHLEKRIEHTSIIQELAKHEYLKHGGDEISWIGSEENIDMKAQKKSLARKVKSFREQAKKIDVDNPELPEDSIQELATRRSFVSLFTSSQLGLGQGVRSHGRPNSDQSNFRNAIIDYYGLKGTGSNEGLRWDVVLGQWNDDEYMQASHLYPCRLGQEMMIAMFGTEAADELFSPLNGLLSNSAVERYFETGFFAIVPDIADDAGPDERLQWQNSEPKEYKLTFLDKPRNYWVPGQQGNISDPDLHQYNKRMDEGEEKAARKLEKRKFTAQKQKETKEKKFSTSGSLPTTPEKSERAESEVGSEPTSRYDKRISRMGDKLWRELDGKRLQFPNNNRPRARYLYFLYCTNLLRFAWRYQEKAVEHVMRPELGKIFWGTPGRYIKKSMLRGLAEEAGHGFDQIIDEGEDEEDDDGTKLSKVLFDNITDQVEAKTRAAGGAASIDFDKDYDDEKFEENLGRDVASEDEEPEEEFFEAKEHVSEDSDGNGSDEEGSDGGVPV